MPVTASGFVIKLLDVLEADERAVMSP